MAVVIKIKQNFVPVEIGSLSLKFDLRDDSVEQLQQAQEALQAVEQQEDAKPKDVLVKAFDVLFQEGIGEKIYAECGESTIIMTQVLMDTFKELLFEVASQRGADVTKYTDEDKEKLFNTAIETVLKDQAEQAEQE